MAWSELKHMHTNLCDHGETEVEVWWDERVVGIDSLEGMIVFVYEIIQHQIKYFFGESYEVFYSLANVFNRCLYLDNQIIVLYCRPIYRNFQK